MRPQTGDGLWTAVPSCADHVPTRRLAAASRRSRMTLTQTTIDRLRGKFLVFDGPDGAGKSVQRERLSQLLADAGLEVVSCRDPGGTTIGDRIRSVLLDYDLSDMDVACETLLFMASRAQLVGQIIRPALLDKKTVLCDRFVTSTCAYQGAAGYDPKRVIELAHFAIGDTWPDLTILLDVSPDQAFQRTGRKPSQVGRRRRSSDHGQSLPFAEGDVKAKPDAMESRSIEFHRKVRQMFHELHAYYPRPVVTIDASDDPDSVFEQIVQRLAELSP